MKHPSEQTNEEWLAAWQVRDDEIKAEELNSSGDIEVNINDVYVSESSWLKTDDLQGKTIPLQIGGVGTHIFNEGKEDEKTQIVLSFNGKEKKLGLNVTNARTVAGLYGNDTDAWVGKEIKLYPTTVEYNSKVVPCIRVVEDMPPEAEFDDIPF